MDVETETILLQYFGQDVSAFITILKPYQAELKARSARAGNTSTSDNGGEASLKETLDWLSKTIPMSTYSYKGRIGDRIGDTIIKTVPVKLDSCTITFDIIDNEAIPEADGYESQLTTRFTVPLGSLAGGVVKKLAKDYFRTSENIEKWIVIMALRSNVGSRRYSSHLVSVLGTHELFAKDADQGR